MLYKFGAICISILWSISSSAALKFEIERVDRAAPGNRVVQLVLTKTGDRHLVYTGCSDTSCENSELYYATNKNNQGWKAQSVDKGNKDTGWFPSLSLDTTDQPHIFYADHEEQELRYASQVNGKWKLETLSSGRGGWWTSSGFKNGNLFVAHTKLPDSGWDYASLEVGHLQNGKWSFETVDANQNAGWFTSMSLLPNGNPVVSYTSVVGQPVGSMKLALRENNKWNILDIDDISIKHHVTVDKNGAVHLVYQKVSPIFDNQFPGGLHDLYYVTNTSGSWVRERLQEGGRNGITDAGQMPRITTDSEGGLHVVSIGERNKLIYARKMSPTSNWETMTVDNLGSPIYPWVEAGQDGQIHMVYEKAGTVYYASCAECARH